MGWWDGTDAFESSHGKTQSTGTVGMRCHQSHLWTASSYLAHWLTTLWGLANIPPPMWKATDMSRLRLSLSPAFFFCSQNRYDGGGRNVKLESGVKFHCVPTSKEITFFTHFERIPPPPRSSVTWELIWTAVAMKGQGLLLCKPWKWSSHTVCLCAPLALLPHLNVYSLTAHSFGNISLWSFSRFDNYADGKWLYQRRQGIGAGFGMQMVRASQRSGMTLD